MSDSRDPHSPPVGTVVLLSLATVIGFAGTLICLRVPTGSFSGNDDAPRQTPVVGIATHASTTDSARPEQTVHANAELNPAVQKPGPPNSEAERIAATLARRAAQAAADLAATQ